MTREILKVKKVKGLEEILALPLTIHYANWLLINPIHTASRTEAQ